MAKERSERERKARKRRRQNQRERELGLRGQGPGTDLEKALENIKRNAHALVCAADLLESRLHSLAADHAAEQERRRGAAIENPPD